MLCYLTTKQRKTPQAGRCKTCLQKTAGALEAHTVEQRAKAKAWARNIAWGDYNCPAQKCSLIANFAAAQTLKILLLPSILLFLNTILYNVAAAHALSRDVALRAWMGGRARRVQNVCAHTAQCQNLVNIVRAAVQVSAPLCGAPRRPYPPPPLPSTLIPIGSRLVIFHLFALASVLAIT